jgi:hypothetical protein
MTSVIDLWRAVAPDARMVSGSVDALRNAVRGVVRARATAPHLPAQLDGEVLVAEAALAQAPAGLDALVVAIHEAGLRPTALILVGAEEPARIESAGDPLPVLVTSQLAHELVAAGEAYLAAPDETLKRTGMEVRLAAAEAALAAPEPGAAAGLVASRLRRGIAVSADGALVALHPRPAGRALAARFAAVHARLLADAPARRAARTVEGLHVLQRDVRPGASVWLFDDLPFARIDEVAAEALTVTLRALLRRPPVSRPILRLLPPEGAPERQQPLVPAVEPEPATDAVLWATAVAVARANGRVATAARELGVHRNTVLYRLRRAAAELGIDPRRPQDAVAILLREQRRQSG